MNPQPFSMPREEYNYQTYIFPTTLLLCHKQKGGGKYDTDNDHRRLA